MDVKITDYFTTLEASQRFDLIRHLIENSEIIPLVRGSLGIGKSHLAARIQQSAPDNWSVCLFEASATLSPEQLLTYIARCYGWSDAEVQEDPLQGLVRRFESMREQGLVPVILIDDAQLLQPTGLITLLRLFERQQAGEPLVSIVLFADEQIDMLLSTPQLRTMSPQSIQVIDLQPLNREDATSFMHFLLQVESLSADLELDSSRLTQLYRQTKGIPGLLRQEILNTISNRGEAQESDQKNVGRIIYFAVPILFLLGAVLLFEDDINQLFNSAESTTVPMPIETQDHSQVEMAGEQNSGKLEYPALVQHQQTPPETEKELLEITATAQVIEDNRDADSMQAVPESGNTNESTAADHDGALALAVDQDVKALSEPLLVPLDQPVALLESTQEPEVFIPPIPKSAVEDSPQELETVSAVVKEEDGPLLEQAVAVQRPIDSLNGSEWVSTRLPEHYTLQLLGVESLISLKEYVSKHALKGEVFYIKTLRNGKPWFSLIWGEFPDKLSAINAQRHLPRSVKRAGIWSRSFGELQKLLDQ